MASPVVTFSGAALVDAPASRAFICPHSDAVDLEHPTRGIYIGETGDVYVDMFDRGSNIPFFAVQAGTLLPLRVKRVRSTGTTVPVGKVIGVY